MEKCQSMAFFHPNGTKISIIRANKHKYSISSMCKLLNITRSLIYYNGVEKCYRLAFFHPRPHKINVEIENAIIDEFNKSKCNYGQIVPQRSADKIENFGFC